MTTISNNLDQLEIARRLINHAQRADDRRKGKPIDEKSATEEAKADLALISGNSPSAPVDGQAAPQAAADQQIKLSELIARLDELNKSAAPQVQVEVQTMVERSASLRYSVLEKIDGLVRRSQNLAETDRYRFEFSDGSTFKITDKWSNRSTTVWGDPHIDVDDVEGAYDGDFKDITQSDSHTTMMLQDGTRLTFTARDSGLIEEVDIFKGSQHLGGIGEDSKQWNAQTGLFAGAVDSGAGKSALPMGDTVYAGGDGNDWYSGSGALLWGKTTAPPVSSRPYSVMQLEYRETIRQQVQVQVQGINQKV